MKRTSVRTLAQQKGASSAWPGLGGASCQETQAVNNLKDQIIQATIVFMADKTKKSEYVTNLNTIATRVDAVCEGKMDLSCC